MTQNLTTEAKGGYDPATLDVIGALAKLGLKKSEARANKEKIRAALEPVIDRHGHNINGQLIGIGGMLLGFVGIDGKTGKVNPVLGRLFPAARGKLGKDLKVGNPDLYAQISQIGPFIREVAYDLHHNWGESGYFGPKDIKAYMASKAGGQVAENKLNLEYLRKLIRETLQIRRGVINHQLIEESVRRSEMLVEGTSEDD